MKIATIINVHADSKLVLDTIDSVKAWVGHDILVVIDGQSAQWGQELPLPPGVQKLEGFRHGHFRAPYRNVAFGLMNSVMATPRADWYCYCEADVLFGSDNFKIDLLEASKRGVWCLGNDLRSDEFELPYLNRITKEKVTEYRYLLGCCVFYKGEFLRKLQTLGFFDRFLYLTNDFLKGYFPDYDDSKGYDLSEHLYPTLANHYGGKVEQFAKWNGNMGLWSSGDFRRYPLRFRPQLDAAHDNFPEACIMHPVKDFNHPLREFHRLKRIGKEANVKQPKLRSCNFGLRRGCISTTIGTREERLNRGRKKTRV